MLVIRRCQCKSNLGVAILIGELEIRRDIGHVVVEVRTVILSEILRLDAVHFSLSNVGCALSDRSNAIVASTRGHIDALVEDVGSGLVEPLCSRCDSSLAFLESTCPRGVALLQVLALSRLNGTIAALQYSTTVLSMLRIDVNSARGSVVP